MPAPLSGPGVGLQLPQSLYPANLTNGEVTTPTNQFSLAAGEALPIPAGRWFITLGKYCSLQYMDPVLQAWVGIRDGDNNGGATQIWSDGFNVRIANLTGCVVGATITNGGAGYTAGTATVTPSTGNSTWTPIVGGALLAVTVTTITGSGYGIAPLVFIDAPPSPGVPATAVATISGGTVTTITLINQGAGYTTIPNVTILPNPADPNVISGAAMTAAIATVTSLTGAGSITGCILTNSGAPVATSMTLTVAGSSTGTATIVPLFLETIATASVAATGVGFGTYNEITTLGGYNTNTGAFTNPSNNLTGFVPRPARIGTVASGGSVTSIGTIYDGGLLLNSGNPVVIGNGIVTTVASITATYGGTTDTVRMQQLS